jgi:uncharacterized membrane protein YfcA
MISGPMDPTIFLPAAGQGVSILLVLAIGLFVGALSGFFGVGAGFLLTPLLVTVGIPPSIAAASCANQCVASTAGGAFAHLRARLLDVRMMLWLLAGGLAGGTAGVQAVRVLRAAGQADLTITLVYVLFLTLLGLHLLRDSLADLRGGHADRRRADARRTRSPWLGRLVARLPARVDFPASGVRHSVLAPLGTGVLVGLVGAFTGVGGSFLLIPAAVSLMRMPMHLAVGTVLAFVCLSSANITFQHAAVNGTVDVLLASLLFAGSYLGGWVGVRAGRWLRADQLRILLAVTVLFVTAKLVLDLALPPDLPVRVVPVGGTP